MRPDWVRMRPWAAARPRIPYVDGEFHDTFIYDATADRWTTRLAVADRQRRTDAIRGIVERVGWSNGGIGP